MSMEFSAVKVVGGRGSGRGMVGIGKSLWTILDWSLAQLERIARSHST